MIDPITWATTYAPTMTDVPSLINMRKIAETMLAKNDIIRGSLTSEQAVADWDPIVDPKNNDLREAIAMIDARLEELNHAPVTNQ